MNVLVYNGPGVSKTSLTHTLSALRTLLLPNYAIQTITAKSLAADPWYTNCALFVLAGGRDLPYVADLKQSNEKISKYVRDGGSFLGLCAGAYYACRAIEWEVGTGQEVCGDRPLRLFNGIGRGCVYPGFRYESEDGARPVTLSVRDSSSGADEQFEGLYYNGGGEFVDAQSVSDANVLAKYTEGDVSGKVAGIHCAFGNGNAILWAIHPEYPLTLEPAISAIRSTEPDLENRVEKLEERRWKLMKDTLARLGLQLPSSVDIRTMQPSPQFLASSLALAPAVATMVDNLTKELVDSDSVILADRADTFQFHNGSYTPDLFDRIRDSHQPNISTSENPVRNIIVLKDGILPSPETTRSFSLLRYFQDLTAAQRDKSSSLSHPQKMGEVLLYGEVVTSTQTMLDKNPKLISYLPVPLLSVATHQIAGRGRGSNTWLSPPGCLQFSLLLRLRLSTFPTSKLVFIQYLFGLAVVEACRSPAVLGAFGDRVRLKWPNDIYVLTEHAGVKKIGGILVNTSFMGGHIDIVVGCGLNVLSPSPMTSLAQLIPAGLTNTELSMERTLATIMATFNTMWEQFSTSASFEPFMDLYLERWLHSDQLVTLTTVDPPASVRIVGITPDHGLLRTMPEPRGTYRSYRGDKFIDLQPDGNSFDLMAGLIKTKT